MSYDSLITELSESYESVDINRLCDLVEYVRAEGILYGDSAERNPEKKAEILELLFKISLGLTGCDMVNTSDKPWWFISEVYDIVFHQVWLDKYPSVCARLYFELSEKVLHERFHKYYTNNNHFPSYGMCIYFIQMADNWFVSRENEFLTLFEKLQPLIGEQPDHLETNWIKGYNKLKNRSGSD